MKCSPARVPSCSCERATPTARWRFIAPCTTWTSVSVRPTSATRSAPWVVSSHRRVASIINRIRRRMIRTRGWTPSASRPTRTSRWRRTEDSKRRRNAVKRRVRALNVRVRMLETMLLHYLAAYASLYALNFHASRTKSRGCILFQPVTCCNCCRTTRCMQCNQR